MSKEIFSSLLAQTLLALVVGVLVAITAHYFVEGARYLLSLRDVKLLTLNLGENKYSVVPIVFMLISAGLIILVRKTLGVTKWSGPADSIYALHQPKVGVDVRVGLGSTIAAFISAGGGASVGQYGPLVHFGATLATIISKLSGKFIRKDVLIACGAAAAISSGFGAPIAGIIFAHEALLRRFSIGGLAPISVASIVAAATNRYLFDANLTFQVPSSDLDLVAVLPFVIIFAPICSGIAIFYMVSLRSCQKVAASGKYRFNTLIFGTAIVVGSIGVFVPEVLGLGNYEINQMLSANYELSFLLLLMIVKIFVTALCIGFGFFGGVFGPALFVGAALGGVLSAFLMQAGFSSDYGTIIALATLAAVGSSVIGAPLTAVLIVLELTGSYQYALMALLSVTLCSTLTYKLFGLSFFDRQLLDRGIDLSRGREYTQMTQISVSEIEFSDHLTFNPGTKGQKILNAMTEKQMTEAYIVDDEQFLLGKINILSLVEDRDNYMDRIEQNPVTLSSDNALTDAIEIASNFVGESIPILEEKRLVGAITEGDLFTKVLALEDDLRNEETEYNVLNK
ncbi:MAG: chloride channel protein [Pseudomonadota bacterium]|nr:chloride channel protein [Pseudomonadota bacterium]